MTNEPTTNTATLSRAIDYARLLGISERLLEWARNTGGWDAPVWAELRDAIEDRIPDDRNVAGVLALVESAALVVDEAQWEREPGGETDRASVRKHDLVMLEAALNTVTGRRSPSPDGYPHAGSEISARGFCEVGYCPCQDRRRNPQPPLLEDAA
ncbi:MAG: hypothetical protein EPO65_07385 [Dehalococcoidia bacterium]|nr:MAG: hypothetical protein EPO65_07385 [Dehalococcoidia bacterium]